MRKPLWMQYIHMNHIEVPIFDYGDVVRFSPIVALSMTVGPGTEAGPNVLVGVNRETEMKYRRGPYDTTS